MFLNLRVSFLVIIFSLIEGSTMVTAGEGLQEDEYLFAKQRFIKLEERSNYRSENVKLKPIHKSKFEILTERIDKLTVAFENYDNLSKQEQKVIREEWKDEVKGIHSEVKEIKIEKFLVRHSMMEDLTRGEFTVPKVSLQSFSLVREHYYEPCVIF